jgi:hypothetical protein
MNDTAPAARVAIVYESMFGNTRQVAEAIAEGLSDAASVTVLRVKDAPETFPDVDLLLVGAPTHAHGLSRPSTRTEAGAWSDDPDKPVALEPDAEGIGVREWLESCGEPPARFAAFDTRADMTELFTGSAASTIDKRLRRLGSHRLLGKHSFLVDKNSALTAGQLDDARVWGRETAAALRAPAKV